MISDSLKEMIDYTMLVENQSKDLQLQLAKGEINYDNEKLQFFIPVIVTEDCLEWLNIIAENILVDEDETVVKNFLAKVGSIREINSGNLREAVMDNI